MKTSRLVSLPTELKVRIVQFLVPVICEPHTFPVDVRNAKYDFDVVLEKVKVLQPLAMTCRAMWKFCSVLLFRAVKLKFNNEGILLKRSDNGSLPSIFHHTMFLSLERYDNKRVDYSDVKMDYDSDEESAPKPLEMEDICLSDLDLSIERVFRHFSSVTTLDLDDVPLSLTNICALQHPKALRTLLIQSPGIRHEYIRNIQDLHSACSFPPVSNICAVIHNTEEVDAVSTVVKLFEKSITMLSISSDDYDEGEDYLAALMYNDIRTIKLEGLRHLNIDLIAFSARALRTVISNSMCLETISIDSRGIPNFLPLCYVLDAVRLAVGEKFDHTPMVSFDAPKQDMDVDMNGFPPARYTHDAPIWKARVARFFCRIPRVITAYGPRRILESLEIYFACEDELAQPLNMDIRLGDLVEVFHTRASMLRDLKSCALATESVTPLESPETEAQLRNTATILHRDFLPSAKRLAIRWGDVKEFSVPSEQKTAEADMEVDELWVL